MSARWIRRIVLVIFAGGIAGMIVGSIADNNGTAVTFGLITAVAAAGLILVTSVAGPGAFGGAPVDEAAAEDVERRVEELVAAGVDEAEVRSLVRAAIRLGRRS
jgi:hypothetical protein